MSPGAVAQVNAPDQFSVRVQFDGIVPEASLNASNYTIDSSYGGLVITDIQAIDSGSVILTTEKQKLGVTYSLQLAGDDGGPKLFFAADTAKFWTVDLSSPNFDEVELTSDRVMVGSHAVAYLQQGESWDNAMEAVAYFDGTIYPTETSMFQAAPDQDGNDRVVLFGLDGKGAYGGYFSVVNTLSNDEAMQYGYHSNETEILYLNTELGATNNEHVVTHEFMHMLYQEHPAHDGLVESWPWHNEGLAECGVRAVTGLNDGATAYFIQDPSGDIAQGLSMVQWQGGNYSQYVLSYMFLSYVAGQLGGVPGYATLFDLAGSPDSFAEVLQGLGTTFARAQMNSLIAAHVQAPSGEYSYYGLLSFTGLPNTTSAPASLPPFSGAFVQPTSNSVVYPGTQGPDIVYVGLNGAGAVDLVAPFDTSGGRLLVFNTNQSVDNATTQTSGNLFPSLFSMAGTHPPPPRDLPAKGSAHAREVVRTQLRLHPPPFNPLQLQQMVAWQRSAGLR